MPTNRHPADELFDIRAEIRALEEREGELRAKLIAGDCDLVGDAYEAQLSTQLHTRFNLKAARQKLEASVLAPFLTTRRVRFVRLTAKKDAIAAAGKGEMA